jgi:hypothetical protein
MFKTALQTIAPPPNDIFTGATHLLQADKSQHDSLP